MDVSIARGWIQKIHALNLLLSLDSHSCLVAGQARQILGDTILNFTHLDKRFPPLELSVQVPNDMAVFPRCSPVHSWFARWLQVSLGQLGAGGGTRTHTACYGPRILSPVRLPFRHTGNRLILGASALVNQLENALQAVVRLFSRPQRKSFQFRHCALPFVRRHERFHTQTQRHGDMEEIKCPAADFCRVTVGKVAGKLPNGCFLVSGCFPATGQNVLIKSSQRSLHFRRRDFFPKGFEAQRG